MHHIRHVTKTTLCARSIGGMMLKKNESAIELDYKNELAVLGLKNEFSLVLNSSILLN